MPPPRPIIDEKIQCRKCMEWKSLNSFYKNKKKRNGIEGYCKSCSIQLVRGRYSVTKARAWSRQRNYGLSEEAYQQLLKEQDDLCAICKGILTRPHVDHNHKTGNVRGILCSACNFGLGFFRDDFDYLQAAIHYLNKHA